MITRKGGKVVTIPLAPRTARAIDLAISERTEGPVFLTADGRRLDRHGAGRIVRRIARRAGITKPVGPHTLRHAFITAALDAGVPLRDVQEAASHADPRTTTRSGQDLAGPARHVHRRRLRRRGCPVRAAPACRFAWPATGQANQRKPRNTNRVTVCVQANAREPPFGSAWLTFSMIAKVSQNSGSVLWPGRSLNARPGPSRSAISGSSGLPRHQRLPIAACRRARSASFNTARSLTGKSG